jgi:beta-lactam-binding protein with PASTA domain
MSKLISYLRTPVFRKNILLAIGSVVAFLLIIFYSLRFYTHHGEATPVPKVEGMPVESAITLLESEGFTYHIDSVYQAGARPGMVVIQDPDEGTMVKRNRTVYLTINTRNAPNVGFPDIVGKNFIEVNAILKNYGLRLGDTIYTADVERDRVISARFGGTLIAKGEDIPKGSRIDLLLGDGRGAGDVDLPDLTGKSLAEAALLLRGLGLSLGTKEYQGIIRDSLDVMVIKQYPAVSDSLVTVPIGTRVDVILSNQ